MREQKNADSEWGEIHMIDITRDLKQQTEQLNRKEGGRGELAHLTGSHVTGGRDIDLPLDD